MSHANDISIQNEMNSILLAKSEWRGRIAPYRLLLLCVGLYLIFSPVWSPRFSVFSYENARWLELILLSVASVSLLTPGFARSVYDCWAALNPYLRALTVVALIGGAVVAGVSPEVRFGVIEVGLMAQLVFFALCIATIVKVIGKEAERTLCVSILAGAGLLVLQFWVTRCQYLYEDKLFSWVTPFLEFANVRFFGQYQAYTLLALPLCLVMFRLRAWQQLLVGFITVNFWALQWMTGTRAVWVGLVAAVFTVLLFARGVRRRWLQCQVLLIVCGALIYGGYLLVVPKITQDLAVAPKNSLLSRGNNSINARITLAENAVEYIVDKPLTGVGPGQFGLVYKETYAAHPHNSVLQLLSEYGVVAGGAAVGIAVFLVALIIQRMKPPRNDNRNSDPVDVALGAALMMGLVDSLFSGNIIMPHSQVLLSLLAGWLLARHLKASAVRASMPLRVPKSSAIRMHIIYPVLLAWAATMILCAGYWEATHTYRNWLPDRPPHFWQYGRLTSW